MDDSQGKMFGRLIRGDYFRRCDLCQKATKIGYQLNDNHLKGFFCSKQHAHEAYEDRVATAKAEGMKLQEEE